MKRIACERLEFGKWYYAYDNTTKEIVPFIFQEVAEHPKIITIPTIYLIRKTCVVGRINMNDSMYPNFFDIDSYIFYENK